MEINNFITLFPELDATKKIPPEEINEILLHGVLNGWYKQAYIQGCYFEMKTFRGTCKIFKQMEIAEQVCEGQTPSKKTPKSYWNYDSHVRKRKGGETALPNNPKKGRAVKSKTKNEVSSSKKITDTDKTSFLHGPGNP